MKVILALDGSACSKEATRILLTQFVPETTVVRVVHADEWPKDLPLSSAFARGPHAAPQLEATHERQRAEAENVIADAVSQLKAAGFEATGTVISGEARQVLLDEADSWPADLIVLGTHGRTGMDRLLLGSVAEAVSRHAPCSVQIVRDRAAG